MQLWDHDCDGLGNARITRKNGVAFQHPFGDVDLGADETDELTISGYLDDTRTFSRPHSISGSSFLNGVTSGLPTRVAAYLFNTNVGVNIDRPRFNFFEDVVGAHYYDHILMDPDATYPTGAVNPLTGKSNYTYGRPGTLRYGRTFPPSQPPLVNVQPGFSRNLICDFAPVLLPSLNVWWPWDFDTAQTSGTPHRYGSNPWWGHYFDTFFCNPSVFWNAPGNTPHRTIALGGIYQGQGTLTHTVPLAIINAPPGSMEWDVNMSNVPNTPPVSTSHLILPFTAYTFVWGPWAPCSGTSATQYQVGVWGWGDTAANCPDIVPFGTQWSGLRINCERFPNATFPNNHSNLQTFLIVQGVDGAEGASAQSSSPCHPSGKPGTTRLRPPAYIGPVRQLVARAMRDGIGSVEWSK